MHDDFGVRYVNTGDWVESCTGLVEHYDGRLEILRWAEIVRQRTLAEAALDRAQRKGAKASEAAAA